MKTRDLYTPNSLLENSETSTSQINYRALEISISHYTYQDIKFYIDQTGDLEVKSQSTALQISSISKINNQQIIQPRGSTSLQKAA